MLEGVLVILDVIVIVIGIGEEVLAEGKDVGRAEVGCGEAGTVGVAYLEDFLGIV